MVSLHERISTYIDRQHQHPSGIVGRVIGERMVRQHGVETRWTLDQLAIRSGDRVLELGFGAREPGLFGPLQAVLDEQVVPSMESTGFTAARVAQGPDNRQFNSVAIIGRK